MIVVDACAWVNALIGGGMAGAGARAALVRDPAWAAPAHMPIEVLRTLQRGLRAGDLTEEQATRCAEVVRDAAIDLVAPEPAMLTQIWSMRDRVNLYDASYVSLAVARQIPLVTADQRLSRAALTLGATVQLISA